jgi:flagellar M-ring protein FliF
LSVLVDNTVRWEGEGSAKHKVLVPPSAETIKTITNLVAAATGLNPTRGDQLIVESLPFESSLNAEPPAGSVPKPVLKPEVPEPAWLQLVRKNRELILPLCAALGIVVLVVFSLTRLLSRRKSTPSSQTAPALPAGSALSPGAALAYSAQMPNSLTGEPALRIAGGVNGEENLEVAERVRQLAQNDVAVAANVVRLWLHETETRTV